MMRVVNVVEILLVYLHILLVVTIQAQLLIPNGLDFGITIPDLTDLTDLTPFERSCAEGSGCSGNEDCRTVFSCLNCPPRTQCVDPQRIETGADEKCKSQGFREAFLLGNVLNAMFRPLPCRGRNQEEDECPFGSECVDDGQSVGICCRGASDRCGVCPEGQGCYDRPPNCIQGQPCITAFVPTCVPHECAFCTQSEECIRMTRRGFACLNPNRDCQYRYECMEKGLCGNRPCPAGQWCTETSTICADPRPNATNIDWSHYGCFKQYECQGEDLCGGCQDGYECVDTGNRCVTEPCPTYECKKIDNCFGKCLFNQDCKASYPDCPSYVPRCNPTFECIDLPGYGSCKMVKIHTGC